MGLPANHGIKKNKMSYLSLKADPLSLFLRLLSFLIVGLNAVQELKTALGRTHMLNTHIDSLGNDAIAKYTGVMRTIQHTQHVC